jgi:DNA-directed RNA polymerase subunit RPC12/RpoP
MMKSNYQARHSYICKKCGTANVFQPWSLGKERLVKCSHCRHLNRIPYIRNPKGVLIVLLFVVSLMLLLSLNYFVF